MPHRKRPRVNTFVVILYFSLFRAIATLRAGWFGAPSTDIFVNHGILSHFGDSKRYFPTAEQLFLNPYPQTNKKLGHCYDPAVGNLQMNKDTLNYESDILLFFLLLIVLYLLIVILLW